MPHARQDCHWRTLLLCVLTCVAVSGCAAVAPSGLDIALQRETNQSPPPEAPSDIPERLPQPVANQEVLASAEAPLEHNTLFDEPIRLPPPPAFADLPTPLQEQPLSVWEQLVNDQVQMYRPRRLVELSAAVGTAAVMANTSIDQNLRQKYQERVRSQPEDEILNTFHLPFVFGNGYYTLPVMTGAAAMGEFYDDGTWQNTMGHWGQRSFRTAIAGAPALLALQYTTGGARPGQSPNGSHWAPFQDSHGASGHAFMGAVPFLAAAKMADNRWIKGGLYATSMLAGFSRFNDDRHYASQVVLGWCVAYVAAEAVEESDANTSPLRFGELPTGGVGLNWEWSR